MGPITPYVPTPRPTPDPSRIRDPAPVVEYSQENPEPPPLNPSYVPQSFKTLSALSGNSIFYVSILKQFFNFNLSFYKRLTWNPHTTNIRKNLDNQRKRLYSLISISFKLPINPELRVYKTFLKTSWVYVFQIFCTDKPNATSKKQRFQWKLLRQMHHFMEQMWHFTLRRKRALQKRRISSNIPTV